MKMKSQAFKEWLKKATNIKRSMEKLFTIFK